MRDFRKFAKNDYLASRCVRIVELTKKIELEQVAIDLISRLCKYEEIWLQSRLKYFSFAGELKDLGWSINIEEWQEDLFLEIDEYLEKRWLDENQAYRKSLPDDLLPSEIEILRGLVRRFYGSRLPQKLMHKMIVGSRS